MMIVPTYRNGSTCEKATSIRSNWFEEFSQSTEFQEADWSGEWAVDEEVANVKFDSDLGQPRYSYQPLIYLLVKAELVE